MVLREKKTYGYRERDALKRATFAAQLATVDPLDLVYADEAGMDHRDQYGYGYSRYLSRCYFRVSASNFVLFDTDKKYEALVFSKFLLKTGQFSTNN